MKVQRCDVCGLRIRNMNDAIFQVIHPKGLSKEVLIDAILKARKQEESSPAQGTERGAYRMLAMGVKLDENDQVIAGRAFQALGYRLVQYHQTCKKDAPESTEYETEGWLDYES